MIIALQESFKTLFQEFGLTSQVRVRIPKGIFIEIYEEILGKKFADILVWTSRLFNGEIPKGLLGGLKN